MVGPDYRQPQTDLPATWNSTATGTSTAETVDITQWWQTFNDPVLSGLIEKARTGNRDVYQAEARVREARARRQLSQANLLPTSSLNASASRTGSSEASGTGITSDCIAPPWTPVGNWTFSANNAAPSNPPRPRNKRRRKI